jgi:hypothetical protein
METINRDVIGILSTYLDNKTLDNLAEYSEDVAINVQLAANNSVFLKKKIENITGLTNLPFINDQVSIEYLKQLVIDLDGIEDNREQLIELVMDGKYEYVYIGLELGVKSYGAMESALKHACENDYPDTVRLILSKSEYVDRFKGSMQKYINLCIENIANNALKELLIYSSRENVLGENFLHLTVMAAIVCANFTAFKLMIDKYLPNSNERDIIERTLLHISMIPEEDIRGEFIEYYLGVQTKINSKILLTEYSHVRRKNTKVSGREMNAILNSDIFTIDVVNPHELSSEGAFVLYTFERDYNFPQEYIFVDGVASEIKGELLDVFVENSALLDKALTYAKPVNPKSIFVKALTVKRDSFNVIIKHYKLSKELVCEWIPFGIQYGFEVDTVLQVCNTFNITIQDFEVLIMEADPNVTFYPSAIEGLAKLGINFSNAKKRCLVAEKIAFKGIDSVYVELAKFGFDFSSCSLDLIAHDFYHGREDYIHKVRKYVIENNIVLPYQNKDTEEKLRAMRYVSDLGVPDTSTLRLIHSRFHEVKWDEVDWEDIRSYEWLDGITLEMATNKYIKAGIPIVKKNIENKILRAYEKDTGIRVNEFRRWLMLANSLTKEITVTETDNTVITIDNTTITISFKISNHDNQRLSTTFGCRGKYKGLDMFSSLGVPLTTRDQIKARRVEITSL